MPLFCDLDAAEDVRELLLLLKHLLLGAAKLFEGGLIRLQADVDLFDFACLRNDLNAEASLLPPQ